MDVEYADDEIGSLEDEEGATRGAAIGAGDHRVQAALDDFLKNYRKGRPMVWLRAACCCGGDALRCVAAKHHCVRAEVLLDMLPSL